MGETAKKMGEILPKTSIEKGHNHIRKIQMHINLINIGQLPFLYAAQIRHRLNTSRRERREQISIKNTYAWNGITSTRCGIFRR